MKLLNKISLVITLFSLVACGGGGSSSSGTNEAKVKSTINVTNLPDSFIYDLDTAQNGTSEFEWRISFDINNDSIINEGDIFFGIRLAASDATPQSTINRSDMQAYLWVYGNGNPTISIRNTEINLTSTNTSFSFSAPVRLHDSLKSITNGTQVFVQTLYRDQSTGTYYYDYYPGKDAYTVGLDTSLLVDSTFDFETNISPVSDKDYPFIDIESISVTIE